jgi:hypothetical protein
MYCVREDIEAVVEEEDEEQNQESEDTELGAGPNLLDKSAFMELVNSERVPTILRVISERVKELLSLRFSALSTTWCSWAGTVRSQRVLCKEICPSIFLSRTSISLENNGLAIR